MLNRDHATRRVALGKSAVIIDTSLDAESPQAAETENARNVEEGDAAIGAVYNDEMERPGDRAFENLTDMQNEDFVFVL